MARSVGTKSIAFLWIILLSINEKEAPEGTSVCSYAVRAPMPGGGGVKAPGGICILCFSSSSSAIPWANMAMTVAMTTAAG